MARSAVLAGAGSDPSGGAGAGPLPVQAASFSTKARDTARSKLQTPQMRAEALLLLKAHRKHVQG